MLKTSTHNTIQTVDIEIIAFIVKKNQLCLFSYNLLEASCF